MQQHPPRGALTEVRDVYGEIFLLRAARLERKRIKGRTSAPRCISKANARGAIVRGKEACAFRTQG